MINSGPIFIGSFFDHRFQVVDIVSGADDPVERLEVQGIATFGKRLIAAWPGEPVICVASSRLHTDLDYFPHEVLPFDILLVITVFTFYFRLAKHGHINPRRSIGPDVAVVSEIQVADDIGPHQLGRLQRQFSLLVSLVHTFEDADGKFHLAFGLMVKIMEQRFPVGVDEGIMTVDEFFQGYGAGRSTKGETA